MRRLLLFLLLAIALLVPGACLLALSAADDALSDRGLTWDSRELSPTSVAWTGLARPGLTLDRLSVDLLPSPRAHARGLTVHLDRLSTSGGGDPERSGLPPLPLSASEVSVWWGETLLASSLSGAILPELSLSSPEALLARDAEGRLDVRLRRVIEAGPLTADVLLTAEGDPDASLTLRAEAAEAILSHPLLAPAPLPPAPLFLQATWNRDDDRLSGEVSLAGLSASFSGTAAITTSLAVDLAFDAPTLSLAEVAALFGSQVPEARRADLRGHFSLRGRLRGPPWRWEATFDAEDLAADGAAPSGLGRLRHGEVEWMAPSAEGPVLQRTGEGYPGWTPLGEARLFAQAAVAAEDARFFAHPGYDVEGINLALAALSAGTSDEEDDITRGGSTISQQLAKNLFLDGERTLARKLRELLLAVEMERVLGKTRILELYVNIVELGPGLYGIRQGADAWFLKRPQNLSPHEAAFLAAILPSPRRWHVRVFERGRAPEAAVDRILANMVHTGALDANTARWAAQERLIFIPPPR